MIHLESFHKEEDSRHISCLAAIVEEHHPFTYVQVKDASYDSLCEWIHLQYQQQFYASDHASFWICKDEDVIGIATIKKQLHEELYAESGHIGLCIHPAYRKQGYGTLALLQLVKEVKKRYALEDILLCCHYDNIASIAMCKRIGAIKKHEDIFVHYWLSDHVDDVVDL